MESLSRVMPSGSEMASAVSGAGAAGVLMSDGAAGAAAAAGAGDSIGILAGTTGVGEEVVSAAEAAGCAVASVTF